MDSFNNDLYAKNRSGTGMLQHVPPSEKALTQEQRTNLRTYINKDNKTQLMHSTLRHYPMFLENPILEEPCQEINPKQNTASDNEYRENKIQIKKSNIFEKLLIGLSFIIAVLSAVDSFIFG